MKKTMALALVLGMMTAVLAGCGDSADSSSAPAATEAATTAAATEAATEAAKTEAATEAANTGDDDLQKLADALDGTMWVGMDDAFNCYALKFEGTAMAFAADDESAISGYWAIGEDTLYIYSDEAMTTEEYNIPWDYDLDTDLLILNNTAIMTQVSEAEAADVAEALTKMATAAQVAEYLDDTYWCTVDDTEAEAMGIKDDKIEIANVNASGETADMTFYWGMDFDYLYVYDTNYVELAKQEWDIATDGSVLSLTDADGKTSEYQQVTQEEASDIMTYLASLVG